jgi:ketosteroid isomerase-like protein
MLAPKDVVRALLDNPTDMASVRTLVTDDFTYVSLNYSHPDLTRIMPWCGTHHGAESLVKTFVDVGRYWETIAFDIEDLFGEGENVAVFGRFTYRSTVLGQEVTTPFAVLAKVTDGRCRYMQFMEDTLATSASFKSGGLWTFKSNPNGEEVSF